MFFTLISTTWAGELGAFRLVFAGLGGGVLVTFWGLREICENRVLDSASRNVCGGRRSGMTWSPTAPGLFSTPFVGDSEELVWADDGDSPDWGVLARR